MTKYPELPDELYELEQSIYDCKNVIYDIKKSEKYADNLDEALDAISTLYKVKFILFTLIDKCDSRMRVNSLH